MYRTSIAYVALINFVHLSVVGSNKVLINNPDPGKRQ